MGSIQTFAKTTLGTVLITVLVIYLLEGYAAPKNSPKGTSVPLRGLKDAFTSKNA